MMGIDVQMINGNPSYWRINLREREENETQFSFNFVRTELFFMNYVYVFITSDC